MPNLPRVRGAEYYNLDGRMEREGTLAGFGLPRPFQSGKTPAISPPRTFPLLFCEVFLIGGGRIAAAVLLVLLGLGVIATPWIWLVLALFLLALTLDGLLRIMRMRKFEAAEIDYLGKEKELKRLDGMALDKALKQLDSRVFYNLDARRSIAAGIVLWWIVTPALLFAVWAWTEPVIGWINPLDGLQVCLIAVGVFGFAAAGAAHVMQPRKRTRWRLFLSLAVLALLFSGIWVRHPYLRPGYPDPLRVKVEQLLKKPDIHATQYHSGVLVEYARELEAKGETRKAGEFFSMATKVDVTNPDFQDAFADFLSRHASAGADAVFRRRAAELRSGVALKASEGPYQLDDAAILPVLGPDSPRGHALVLVADLQTPVELLDVVGSVLRKELGVEVYRHPQQVDFSKVAGRRGSGDDPQIRIDDAWRELASQIPLPRSVPRQHIVITARDLYGEGRNYLFSSPTGPFGGVVSYHRLGKREDPCHDPDLLDKLCKQSLATAIKSLTIYPCPDSRDVTAYVNGPFQLQRKGRRPLPATLEAYRFGIARWTTELAREEKLRRGP